MFKVKKRVFEATVLKEFSNFHTLKRFIVISSKMPLPSDLPLKDNDELIETKELHHVEVVIKDE